MIRSMTGFGRGKYECDGREYLVEIKSVNHKYSDINIRMPKTLNGLENRIRKEIDKVISRGKIDVYIEFQNFSDKGVSLKFNKELAKTYIQNLQELGRETGINFDLNVIDISKMPDILKKDEENDEEMIFSELVVALKDALDKFIAMREKEGERLVEDIKARNDVISGKINEISSFSAGLVEEYVVKLETRIKELLKTDVIDETRLAQEIVIFSDKCSIEEELTRLRSHISQLYELLNEGSPIGKKIDFLIQEMNRETNTIASKANSIDITNLVIEVKTEIENIREQIQNIE